MKVFKTISSMGDAHDDFIHDVAYDFYGKRMASCSSDRKIKVRGARDFCYRFVCFGVAGTLAA